METSTCIYSVRISESLQDWHKQAMDCHQGNSEALLANSENVNNKENTKRESLTIPSSSFYSKPCADRCYSIFKSKAERKAAEDSFDKILRKPLGKSRIINRPKADDKKRSQTKRKLEQMILVRLTTIVFISILLLSTLHTVALVPIIDL